MKTVLLILLLTGLFPYILSAQTEVKEGVKQDTLVKTKIYEKTTGTRPYGVAVRFRNTDIPDKFWHFDASYGMAFGDQTTFNFIPQVRYSQNLYFSVGGGLNYIYYYLSHKGEKQKMNYAGINAFARLTPLPYLAFQVQPEILVRWGKENGHKTSGRFVPTLLAGGGFILPLGPGDISLLFLFDIIQNSNTPYGKNLYYTLGYSFPF